MRYYEIIVGGQTLYASHPNGVTQPPDPGALQVEVDLISYTEASTNVQSWVRVHGVSIQDISQGHNLNGQTMTVLGGMGKGLPLANPQQSGVLITGQVNQAFGNWIGTDMTLDLQPRAWAGNSPPPPGPSQVNMSVNWKSGMALADAINSTLTTAYPGASIAVSILGSLVLNHDEQGFYGTLPRFAEWVKGVSQDLIDPASVYRADPSAYQGVEINVAPDGSIRVFDGTQQSSNGAKAIQFTDLIGQPTWLDPGTIQVTCVMRADIHVGDTITLPATPIITTTAAQSAYSQLRQDSIFQGTFLVNGVRHVGNYKSPSAAAWVTTLICAINAVAGGGAANSGGASPPSPAPVLSTQSTPSTSLP